MKLVPTDLVALARGAAFLGTGGGGDPYIGRLLAEQAIREHGMPDIVEPEDLPDEAVLMSAAMIGAPTVLVEKVANGEDIVMAVRKVEERLGRKATHIVPIEIGGCNSMIPIVAAARMGLPLVNADGMGRAFPELQMVTFNVYGVSCTPCSIVDEHLNAVVIDAQSAKQTENIARVVVVELGLSAMFSSYPMSGADLKRTGVLKTMTMALDIGRAIEAGRRERNPVGALIECLRSSEYYNRCKILFSGKVTDLLRETTGGFSIGHCRLTSLTDADDHATVSFQNEHLVVRRGETPLAMVPDLICIIDSETAEPITTEGLRYGQRVHVIATSAPPTMRTPEALAVFGPRCFGLDMDFQPLETMHDDV